jgi:hypothetical protein
VPSSTKIFEQVEDALADARILDRDLMRELLELAKTLETALLDSCRTNLEMKAADRNVVAATNKVRESLDALNTAYTAPVQIENNQVERLFELQLSASRTKMQEQNRV